MKKMILIAMTAVLFTACGNDDSNKSSANTNNINNKNTNNAELAICSEDNAKSYREAVDAANKVSSYFNQDGSLTPSGQMADVNNAAASAKTACAYFVSNYGPIDCKTVASESVSEAIVRGSEVSKSCESTTKFLESIGR